MTQLLVDEFDIEIANQPVKLLPTKLAWWPSGRTLLVADLHLGKAATFRNAGIPVPAGTTKSMLDTLKREVQFREADTLVVLGDLTHSSIRANRDYEDDLNAWRRNLRARVILVKGNHDTLPISFYRNLDIELATQRHLDSIPFELTHDPIKATNARFNFSGHLHPAVAIGRNKLECFWFRPNQIVLPAFGEFTGTHLIKLSEHERAIAVCQDQLAVVERPGTLPWP